MDDLRRTLAGPYLDPMEFVLALAAVLVTFRLMAPVLGITEGTATSRRVWKWSAALLGVAAAVALIFG